MKKLIILTFVLLSIGILIFTNGKLSIYASEAVTRVKSAISNILAGKSNPQIGEEEIKSGKSVGTIIFNPSGTHIKGGQLKVRVDIYPEPGFKTYEQHDVDVLDAQGKPTGEKQLNPMLSHFITISEDTTKEELENYIKQTFDADTIATLDNALIQPNSTHLISPFMYNKPKMHTNSAKRDLTKLNKTEENSVIDSVNAKMNGLNLKGSEKGSPTILQPGSIDVGPGAIDRSGMWGEGKTLVDQTNPANASGTIDTWELWFATTGENVEVATFYVVSGSNLSTRDSESIGHVTAGSKQTFTGLSTDIATNDYAGAHSGTGYFEFVSSGGTGVWVLNSDGIPSTNTFFIPYANWIFSIYGTGIEPPTPTPIPAVGFNEVQMGGGICVGDSATCAIPWFDRSWSYRKQVKVSHASGALSNYQMKILVGESSGASGEEVDLGGLAQTDFDDLRFTNFDGALLDYWIESVSGTTPNQLATVWVEFDSIGTSDTPFYMYYGNGSASNGSNGNNTFIFFDDFSGSSLNTAKWQEYATNVTVSGGTATTYNGSVNLYAYNTGSGGLIPSLTTWQLKMRTIAYNDYARYGCGYRDQSLSTGYSTVWYEGPADTWTSFLGTSPATGLNNLAITVWHNIRITYDGSSGTFYLDDVSKKTLSTSGKTLSILYLGSCKRDEYDWVFLSKFDAASPVFGGWGNQETQ